MQLDVILGFRLVALMLHKLTSYNICKTWVIVLT